MKKLGKDLEFISGINKDGRDVTIVEYRNMTALYSEEFLLIPLSLSQGTYIASGFNSYIVKLKPMEEKEDCKHTSIEEIQGGQIERCRSCGKTWGG